MQIEQSSLGKILVSERSWRSGEKVLVDDALISWIVPLPENAEVIRVLEEEGRQSELLHATIVTFLRIDEHNYPMFMELAMLDVMKERVIVERICRKICERIAEFASKFEYLNGFLLACLTNAHFTQVMKDGELVTMCGLFPMASRMNHCCNPSTVFVFKNSQLLFNAVRDIEAGDEVTCSYLQDYQLLFPPSWRRKLLLSEKYFNCQCTRCLNEQDFEFPIELEHVLAISDRELMPDEREVLEKADNALSYLLLAHHYKTQIDTLPDFISRPAKVHEKYLISSYNFFCAALKSEIPLALVGKWLLFGVSPWNISSVCEWLALSPGRYADPEPVDLNSLDSLCCSDYSIEELIRSILRSGGKNSLRALVRCKSLDFSRVKDDLFFLKNLQ